jgi:nucleoid-associated protein YgaU
MYDIAKKQYGDTKMYVKIVNANLDLSNPHNIHEGQELLLPIVDESKSYSDILRFK